LPRRDGRDLARALLDRAADDITLVRRVVDDAEIADAIVGFHAQQAVERPSKQSWPHARSSTRRHTGWAT